MVSTPNIPVYQVTHSSTGEHIYTTSKDEVSNLTSKHGYKNEGIAWYAPRENGKPVYRLFNNSGYHRYTGDENEVKSLTASGDWTIDHKGQPVFYSGGEIPVYRATKTDSQGIQTLTTDESEYNNLGNRGWRQDGITFYATSEKIEQNFAEGESNINNTESEYSIQANVKLNGSGSGFHAKLVACTSQAAVSFGIQYDAHAAPPYTGQTTFLIENVASNNKGEQDYIRTGYAELNRQFNLMLTVQKDGKCRAYINGTQVGEVINSNLAEQTLYLRVEGSGRQNGDTVTAEFSEIKLKGSGEYVEDMTWGTHPFLTNIGIDAEDKYDEERTIIINGKVSGLNSKGDWDSQYEEVSGIIQFVEPPINHLALALKAWWKQLIESNLFKFNNKI